jgi:hypothetical protein
MATLMKPLNQEQSGRTRKFAEVLAKATTVFGSREEVERWLKRPAIGLEQWRPIDLLATRRRQDRRRLSRTPRVRRLCVTLMPELCGEMPKAGVRARQAASSFDVTVR